MNAAANAISKYRNVQITTASPGQMIVMLYDGLLRFLGEAQVAMSAKDRARSGERIDRSLAIIELLLASLDPKVLPELCAHLSGLYVFSMQRITEANLQQDPKKLADVVRILTPLRDAWVTAAQKIANGETVLPSR